MKLHTYDKSKDETEEKVRYLVHGMFKKGRRLDIFGCLAAEALK